jgi:hypothetical protein
MGLLDDAIREHLDLKRRRGADPADIERAERDALGPVRRGPEGSDEADLDHLPADDERFAYDQEDEQGWAEPTGHEPENATRQEEYQPAFADEPEKPSDSRPPFDADDPLAAPTAAHPAPEPDAAPESPRSEPVPAQPDRDPDEPVSRDHGTDRPDPAARGTGDTAEFDMAVEDEELGVAGEDVLEETPEFLQDTPDHDRLWFEQRPPKDFDFDG